MAYFAASTDTPQKNKEFAESLGVDYPLLADPETKTDKDVKPDSAGDDVAARLAALRVPKRK